MTDILLSLFAKDVLIFKYTKKPSFRSKLPLPSSHGRTKGVKKVGETSHDEIKELGVIFTFQVSPGAARNQTYSGLCCLSSSVQGQGISLPCYPQTSQVNAKISWRKKNTWGWLRDRIMAENRGLRPRTADKSMGKKFVPKMPPSSLAVRKNKKPRRGVKAQS